MDVRADEMIVNAGSPLAAGTCTLDSVIRRAVAIISAKPASAVVSVSTSGVLVCTPRAVHASTSTLL
jgi:hypothetical protein